MFTPSGCSGDCACTSYANVLAIDTSHVCLLGRIAARQNDQEAVVFVELVEIHRCQGARQLVTSTALLEVELNLADPECPVRKFAESVPLDALNCLAALPAGSIEIERLQNLDCLAPDDTPVILNDHDATLVVAADGANNSNDDVALVTDDERLLVWQKEMMMRGEVGALAAHGLELLAEMVSCNALNADAFLGAAEIEEARYWENLGSAATWIQQTKQDRLQRLTTAVAAVSGWEDG